MSLPDESDPLELKSDEPTSEPPLVDPPESPESTPLCWRCGATIRVTVRFCGQCGIPTRPDDFLSMPPVVRSKLGLGVALGTYFVLLATLVGMMLAEISSMRTVLRVAAT